MDANDLSGISIIKVDKASCSLCTLTNTCSQQCRHLFPIAITEFRSYATWRQLKTQTSVPCINNAKRCPKSHRNMRTHPFTLKARSIPWQYILHGDILDAKESSGVSIINVDKASSPWVTFGTTYYNEGISPQWSPGDIHEAWHLPRNLKLQNMNHVSWWLRIIFLDHPRKHQIRSKKKLIAPAKDVSFQYRGQTRKCSEHAATKRFYARKIVQKLS